MRQTTDVVNAHRATHAALIPSRSEHDMIHDELAATFKHVDQADFAIRAIEDIIFSIATIGRRRRSAAKASRAKVASFSLTKSALRTDCHSSNVTMRGKLLVWVLIFHPPFGFWWLLSSQVAVRSVSEPVL